MDIAIPAGHCPIPWSEELFTLSRRHGPRLAIKDADSELTYQALCSQAHRLAQWLLAQAPGHRPPRVGVLLQNSRASVVADYGISIAGGSLVHLNPACAAGELSHCLSLVPVDLVLTETALAPRLAALDVPVHVQWQAHAAAMPEVSGPLPPADPAVPGRILYTSGTSGPPKAVVYSHFKRWTAAVLLRATLPYRPEGTGILLMTPYVHGASMLARAYLDTGGWVALHQGVQARAVEQALREPALDAVFAPPSVLAKLLDTCRPARPLRCIFSGTQPLPRSLYQRARERFGACIRVTYGKSENFNPISILEIAEGADLYTDPALDRQQGCCVGLPAPGVSLRIADDGEVLLRSQHMYDGYLTHEGWLPHAGDAWHATGDLGRFDARGRLWLTGRKTLVINTGGYKINPEEPADRIRAVPAVADALVVGIASDYWTEIPVCGYVPAQGAQVSEDMLRDAVADLTPYKQPRLYLPLADMPSNAVGKPSPQGLRDYIARHYILHDGPRPRLEPGRP